MSWLIVVDILLALGLNLRLNRLVIADTITEPMRDGVDRRSQAWKPDGRGGLLRQKHAEFWDWVDKLISCPFCIGFWLGCVVLLSLWLVGGPGEAAEAWRWVAGAFTLNWVAAHVGSRLGDAGYDEE